MLLSGLNSLRETWCWIISRLYFHHVTAWKMTLACMASGSFTNFSACCNTLAKRKKKNFFNGFLFFVSSYFETEMLLILVPSSLSHTRAHTHTHAPHTHTSSEPLMTGSSWAISSATGQSVRGRTESWQRRTTRHSQIPERHAAKMKRWRGQTGRESRQRGSKSGGGVCGTGDF